MMPSLFIAHGAPTLALEEHAYTRALQVLSRQLPRPRAVVLFSAHWESPVQLVSGAQQHSLIYDFYGFPDEMYQLTYPAKGDADVTAQIRRLFTDAGIACEIDDRRGLDHGAWVVLRLLYPDAAIPVVALSVNPMLPPREQYRIGRALAPLRQQDILIIGSGGTVHNLRRIGWNSTTADDWAVQFDDWIADRLQTWDLELLFEYEAQAPHAREAVPRNEHFIPLFLAMGAADDNRKAALVHRSYQYGSLSLSCWQFG